MNNVGQLAPNPPIPNALTPEVKDEVNWKGYLIFRLQNYRSAKIMAIASTICIVAGLVINSPMVTTCLVTGGLTYLVILATQVKKASSKMPLGYLLNAKAKEKLNIEIPLENWKRKEKDNKIIFKLNNYMPQATHGVVSLLENGKQTFAIVLNYEEKNLAFVDNRDRENTEGKEYVLKFKNDNEKLKLNLQKSPYSLPYFEKRLVIAYSKHSEQFKVKYA